MEDDWTRLQTLKPNQPYMPNECEPGAIATLTAADFRLSSNGTTIPVVNFKKEGWLVPVRDNRGWHNETALTPRGSWSSTDLSDAKVPPTPFTFYRLSFPNSEPGCPHIRVRVPGRRAKVFAPSRYCAERTPSDVLRGTKPGRKLEKKLRVHSGGQIPLFLLVGVVRDRRGRPFADVTLKFPPDQLDIWWDSLNRLRSKVGILGIVYRKDGTPVARFSDLLWPDYWPTIVRGYQGEYGIYEEDADDDGGILGIQAAAFLPERYETQVPLSPGEYRLRMVLTDGKKYGHAEAAFRVGDAAANSFVVDSVLLCKRFRDARVAQIETSAAGLAPEYEPLDSKGARFTPTADTRFAASEHMFAYFDIYVPQPERVVRPQLQAHVRIVDAATARVVKQFPAIAASAYAADRPVIPIGTEVPIANLPDGNYRLEVRASDSAGHATDWQAATFTIGPHL